MKKGFNSFVVTAFLLVAILSPSAVNAQTVSLRLAMKNWLGERIYAAQLDPEAGNLIRRTMNYEIIPRLLFNFGATTAIDAIKDPKSQLESEFPGRVARERVEKFIAKYRFGIEDVNPFMGNGGHVTYNELVDQMPFLTAKFMGGIIAYCEEVGIGVSDVESERAIRIAYLLYNGALLEITEHSMEIILEDKTMLPRERAEAMARLVYLYTTSFNRTTTAAVNIYPHIEKANAELKELYERGPDIVAQLKILHDYPNSLIPALPGNLDFFGSRYLVHFQRRELRNILGIFAKSYRLYADSEEGQRSNPSEAIIDAAVSRLVDLVSEIGLWGDARDWPEAYFFEYPTTR